MVGHQHRDIIHHLHTQRVREALPDGVVRRRLLDPRLSSVGLGEIAQQIGPHTNVLWPSAGAPPATSGPITWPSAGMFPEALLGSPGRWSISTTGVSLDQATVQVTRNGHLTSAEVLHRSNSDLDGAGALIFSVPDAQLWDTITVTVTAPGFNHTWSSTLVN